MLSSNEITKKLILNSIVDNIKCTHNIDFDVNYKDKHLYKITFSVLAVYTDPSTARVFDVNNIKTYTRTAIKIGESKYNFYFLVVFHSKCLPHIITTNKHKDENWRNWVYCKHNVAYSVLIKDVKKYGHKFNY